mgnify:CR=1 FL=1
MSSSRLLHTLTIVLILLAILAGWGYYTMVSHRSATHRSAQELIDCVELVAQIQAIDNEPKRAQSGELAHTDLTQRIEKAADSSGIDKGNLNRISSAPPRRLAKLPYEERPTSIALGSVTLPQLVQFLHQLSDQAEGLWIKDITLRAPRGEEVGDRWTADATISYLIYIPESE